MFKQPDFYVLRFDGTQWVIPQDCLEYVGGSIGSINRKQLLFKVQNSGNSGQMMNFSFVATHVKRFDSRGRVTETVPLEFESMVDGKIITRRVYVPALQREAAALTAGLQRNLTRNHRIHRVNGAQESRPQNLYRL